MCNWVFDRRVTLENLELHPIAEKLSRGCALQVHSDGGFDGQYGASAAVLVCLTCIDGVWVPAVEGYRGVFLESARSAFHAELVAADMAIELANAIGEEVARLRRHSKVKRVRFLSATRVGESW